MSFVAERQDAAARFQQHKDWARYEAELNAIEARAAKWSSTVERKRAPRPKRCDEEAPEASPYYARASETLYNDKRLNDTARRLVLKLMRFARGRRSVTAYVPQLADELGRSQRMVQLAQKRAAECGYIRIDYKRTGKVNQASAYHLLEPCFPAPSESVTLHERRRRQRRSRRGVVKNLSPHEQGPSVLPPYPPEGEEMTTGAKHARPSTHRRQPTTAHAGGKVARQGGSSSAVPHDDARCELTVDLEEFIAARAQAPP